MEFNLPKYLTENKLTHQSFVREEEDVLDTSTDLDGIEPEDEPEGGEIDIDGQEEPTDDWDQAETDGSEEFEKEPTAKDIKEPAELSGVHKKQADLKKLVDYKDAILMRYKSGQLGLDQYKEMIGNVPQQIKKLKSQIEKAMTVTLGDEEGEI